MGGPFELSLNRLTENLKDFEKGEDGGEKKVNLNFQKVVISIISNEVRNQRREEEAVGNQLVCNEFA